MLQNVTVKNKITGEHLGIFESLSESETDQKNAIKTRFGSGAFKLHWGKWKTENGKKVFRPTSRVIYISENGAEPKKHPVTSIGWRRILSARGYEKIHEASRHILDYLNAKLGAK